MNIQFYRATPDGLITSANTIRNDLLILCQRYAMSNIMRIELYAGSGLYIDTDIEIIEYYRVIFKTVKQGIVKRTAILCLYVARIDNDGYCFINRQTEYCPEQLGVH